MGADIHSPALTIRESLVFSAETRLLIEDQNQLQEFVDEARPQYMPPSCMPPNVLAALRACQPAMPAPGPPLVLAANSSCSEQQATEQLTVPRCWH